LLARNNIYLLQCTNVSTDFVYGRCHNRVLWR